MAEVLEHIRTTALPVLRQRIRRLSLREQIAAELQELVVSGLLQPGDDLPSERELSTALEVSRESLRGALQLLAERGVVDIGHGVKTRIKQMPEPLSEDHPLALRHIDRGDDAALFEARELLEPHLTGLAAKSATEADITRLNRMIDAQRHMVDDAVHFVISDREFHGMLFKMAASPMLASFALQAHSRAYAHRRDLIERHDGVRLAVKDHEAIVEALAEGSSERAANAMRAHLATIRGLLANVAKHAGPAL